MKGKGKMKEFNIEDLELEKINTIEIEKHFFKINKEDKIENKFIGLRIFTNRIDEKNLNNNNLKYLNTNEKEFKRNFLDTLTFEKVISKKTENNNENNKQKANDKSKYDVVFFYKLHTYQSNDYYYGRKENLYLEIVGVRDLKNGLFSIPILAHLPKQYISSIHSKDVKLEFIENINTNYNNLIRLMINYDLKVLNEKNIDLISKEIYETLKSEINECIVKPYELKSLANIEKDIEKEREIQLKKSKNNYYDYDD
jgi:hypothetical protein